MGKPAVAAGAAGAGAGAAAAAAAGPALPPALAQARAAAATVGVGGGATAAGAKEDLSKLSASDLFFKGKELFDEMEEGRGGAAEVGGALTVRVRRSVAASVKRQHVAVERMRMPLPDSALFCSALLCSDLLYSALLCSALQLNIHETTTLTPSLTPSLPLRPLRPAPRPCAPFGRAKRPSRGSNSSLPTRRSTTSRRPR